MKSLLISDTKSIVMKLPIMTMLLAFLFLQPLRIDSKVCNYPSKKANNCSFRCHLANAEDFLQIPVESCGLVLQFRPNYSLTSNTTHYHSFPSLPRLKKLEIYVLGGPKMLPGGIFSSLEGLDKLNLFHYDSKRYGEITLDNLTFYGLTKLSVLDLPDLGLRTLPVKVFDGLERLERLDLNQNHISRLVDGTFRNCCKRIWNLVLAKNFITDLASDVSFTGLDALAKLDLHGNKISILRNYSFRGVERLTEINLARNGMVTIEPSAFDGLPNLITLFLDGNQLSHISPDVFKGLSSSTELSSLDLSGNLITALHSGTFSSMKSLNFLELSNNKISFVHDEAFALSNLTQLSLKGNSLRSLPSRIWAAEFQHLSSIDLSDNPWQCSCGMSEILTLLNRNIITIVQEDKTVCNFNDDTTRTAELLNFLRFQCSPTALPTISADSSGTIATEYPRETSTRELEFTDLADDSVNTERTQTYDDIPNFQHTSVDAFVTPDHSFPTTSHDYGVTVDDEGYPKHNGYTEQHVIIMIVVAIACVLAAVFVVFFSIRGLLRFKKVLYVTKVSVKRVCKFKNYIPNNASIKIKVSPSSDCCDSV